jgi:hypothetical protein
MGSDYVNWIYMSQDRVRCKAFVISAMNFNVPCTTSSVLIMRATISFSRRNLTH